MLQVSSVSRYFTSNYIPSRAPERVAEALETMQLQIPSLMNAKETLREGTPTAARVQGLMSLSEGKWGRALVWLPLNMRRRFLEANWTGRRSEDERLQGHRRSQQQQQQQHHREVFYKTSCVWRHVWFNFSFCFIETKCVILCRV